MSRRSPFEIRLSPEEAKELQRRASSRTLQYRQVVRAKMILLAAQDLTNDEIAAHLGTRREVVSRWRKRFFQKRLAGLDAPVRGEAGEPEAPPPTESNLLVRSASGCGR